ncbi:putative ORfan [Saudi moumouvirus]|nr:putative ORfan [Saudi moumouvirus]
MNFGHNLRNVHRTGRLDSRAVSRSSERHDGSGHD